MGFGVGLGVGEGVGEGLGVRVGVGVGVMVTAGMDAGAQPANSTSISRHIINFFSYEIHLAYRITYFVDL